MPNCTEHNLFGQFTKARLPKSNKTAQIDRIGQFCFLVVVQK